MGLIFTPVMIVAKESVLVCAHFNHWRGHKYINAFLIIQLLQAKCSFGVFTSHRGSGMCPSNLNWLKENDAQKPAVPETFNPESLDHIMRVDTCLFTHSDSQLGRIKRLKSRYTHLQAGSYHNTTDIKRHNEQ